MEETIWLVVHMQCYSWHIWSTPNPQNQLESFKVWYEETSLDLWRWYDMIVVFCKIIFKELLYYILAQIKHFLTKTILWQDLYIFVRPLWAVAIKDRGIAGNRANLPIKRRPWHRGFRWSAPPAPIPPQVSSATDYTSALMIVKVTSVPQCVIMKF